MDWAQILVFLLAILFSIFLIVAIILAVLMVQTTRQIKAAAKSAERTIHTLEDSVATLSKTTMPLMIAKTIAGQVMKRGKKEKKPEDV